MRKIILAALIFVPSVARAETCACLEEKYLTDECIDWSYSDEAAECRYWSWEEVQIDLLQEKDKKLEARIARLEKATKKVKK